MIAIIAPYPHALAPSQRFRFEQYVDINSQNIDFYPFWNASEWPRIYKEIPIALKVLFTIKAFSRRLLCLFKMGKYQRVFIHREATPIGPAWFEWCLHKIFSKEIIYDFDDAIWLPNASETNQKLVGKLKTHNKVANICSWAKTVTVGNQFLADYARQFCKDVRILPTTIDTEHLHNPAIHLKRADQEALSASGEPIPRATIQDERGLKQTPPPLEGVSRKERFGTGEVPPLEGVPKAGEVIIGWTGTHSTLKQLTPLFPLLEKLHSENPFHFLLIADKAPEDLPHFVEFLPWNKSTEIKDLMRIDIGIMPLFNTDWERGKCGFKALQYMALSTPCVISNVGVNTEIITDQKNGYLAESMPLTAQTKWLHALKTLLQNPEQRQALGSAGRQTIIDHYSVIRYTSEYQRIFKLS